MKFDWTINIGNLLAAVTFLVLATVAWIDLRWRVKNLETWRDGHQIDADKRDEIIVRMDKLLYHLTGGEEKSVFIRRANTQSNYTGPERRRK